MIIAHFALVSSSNKPSLNGKLREANVLYAGGFYHVLDGLGAEYECGRFFHGEYIVCNIHMGKLFL